MPEPVLIAPSILSAALPKVQPPTLLCRAKFSVKVISSACAVGERANAATAKATNATRNRTLTVVLSSRDPYC